jgi:hypothetical protein
MMEHTGEWYGGEIRQVREENMALEVAIGKMQEKDRASWCRTS